MDDATLLTHLDGLKDKLTSVASTQAAHGEKLLNVERAVLGNGQPGLTQKVEDLQKSRNLLWGAGALGTTLLGVAEWFFHRGH